MRKGLLDECSLSIVANLPCRDTNVSLNVGLVQMNIRSA